MIEKIRKPIQICNIEVREGKGGLKLFGVLTPLSVQKPCTISIPYSQCSTDMRNMWLWEARAQWWRSIPLGIILDNPAGRLLWFFCLCLQKPPELENGRPWQNALTVDKAYLFSVPWYDLDYLMVQALMTLHGFGMFFFHFNVICRVVSEKQ